MKEKFIENGIEYVKNGNYYIQNLTVLDDKVYNIGKYGRLHSIFIKGNGPCLYSAKMLKGTWLAYLDEIDTSAKELVINTDRLLNEDLEFEQKSLLNKLNRYKEQSRHDRKHHNSHDEWDMEL